MSRAFYPPETLSEGDKRTMAQVRRDIWTSGLTGLAVGSVAGYTIFASTRLTYNRLSESAKARLGDYLPHRDAAKLFNRNVAFLSVMAGGALGSFLLAVTSGKNKVHRLHDIFQLGKIDNSTSYQKEADDGSVYIENSTEHLAQERQRRITARRNTMRHRIEEGHGISDAHGGHWLQEQSSGEEDDEKRKASQNR